MSRSTIRDAVGPGIEFDKRLAPFTSFGTGGAARYFISAQTVDDVVRAIMAAGKLNLPFFILGGGSNLLVSDRGYDGLVIRIDIRGLKLIGDSEIECGAGEKLSALVDFAAENSLSGLEFARGIWGTVGGAVFGNAGAFGGDIGSLITEVSIIGDDEKTRTVGLEYCRFGYRCSHFKTSGEAIVKARFKLNKGDIGQIKSKMEQISAVRRDRHPVNGHCAGCFFKNIPDPNEPGGKLPAGRLLEKIGAKDMAVGGARVYQKHANIIVNADSATSTDIRTLAGMLKKKVQDRFGITLEEEVVQLGEF